ncbi:MAG: hypothetical protein ACPK85_04255 [Methanosarcina sp.]
MKEPIPKLKIIAFNPVFQIINCAPDNISNFEKLELIGKNEFWDSLKEKYEKEIEKTQIKNSKSRKKISINKKIGF